MKKSTTRPIRYPRPRRPLVRTGLSRSYLTQKRLTPDGRRCLCCTNRATFFLCDENGVQLPKISGGYCASCRPTQPAIELLHPLEYGGVPAALHEVEDLSLDEEMQFIEDRIQWRALLASVRLEIAQLRGQLPCLPLSERAEVMAKINALSDLLGIENEVDIELAAERPYTWGFEDLPAPYFLVS